MCGVRRIWRCTRALKRSRNSRRCSIIAGLASPIPLALAHLQLARAFVLMGDKAKAKTAYQDFLTLWKGADPGVPVVAQAKAEYAKL